jgi:hypothetical protein
MPLRWPGGLLAGPCSNNLKTSSRWIPIAFLGLWLALASAMSPARISELREETVAMFYHGFDNYMNIAFPEDEVRRTYKE